jgi:hypothetical protein
MFSKPSRYRRLPDVVTTDAKGRALRSKSVRLLPQVSGDFFHTVEEIDRLDHLAYKYYRQPRKWWRICDANPAFASPQALLGGEPLVTARFPLNLDDGEGQFPWADLLRRLSAQVGVENLQVVEELQLVPEEQTIDSRQVTLYVEHYERAVIVTYNQMTVSAAELDTVMSNAGRDGLEVGQPEMIGRVGKRIVIPPDTVR